MPDQWDAIGPGPTPDSINLRRADPGHPLDFFRGKDHLGRYIFSIQGNFSRHAGRNLPTMASLEITLNQRTGGVWDFSIRLLDATQVDIFRALCANLLAATEGLDRGQDLAGVEVVLSRLHRWQDLLRARREKVLSQSQMIGLFGELLLLRDFFQPRLAPPDAIRAWRGPHTDEQDFLLGDWLIEVKTQLSTSDSRLQISSENQLDSSSGKILVCHQTLGTSMEENLQSRTLNSLVQQVATMLSHPDAAAVDRFQANLIECGYARRSEYDTDYWVLNDRTFFSVTDGFPRITPATLPPGVDAVRYEIKVEACQGFKIQTDTAAKWIFGKHD